MSAPASSCRRLAILQFDSDNPPGYLATWLAQRGHDFTLLRLDQLPHQAMEGFNGYALMGGPMMVGDPLPWMSPVLTLLRHCLDASIPVIGHCLGAQLLAAAAGAQVGPSPHPEVGWVDVSPCTGPLARQILADAPNNPAKNGENVASLQHYPVFHWHLQSFSLPAGAEPVLTRAESPQQAFALGPHQAYQAHIEIEEMTLRQWYTLNPHPEQHYPIGTIQTAEQARAEAHDKILKMRSLSDSAYRYWLAQVYAR